VILGVARTATPQEIKVAYFKAAKTYHPDVNPGDAKAAAQFRACAEAYELLSNATTRATYDRTGRRPSDSPAPGSSSSNSYSSQTTYDADAHARSVFESLWADIEVLKQALSTFSTGLRNEVSSSYESAKSGDWQPALQTVVKNGGPLAIIATAVLLLRFPALIAPVAAVALRVAASNPAMALRLGHTLWSYLVQQAKEKNVESDQERARADEMRRRGHGKR
jgi:hypothetical protein